MKAVGRYNKLVMIFVLLMGSVVFAQNEIDSLKKIIANQKMHDTTKLAPRSAKFPNFVETI